MKNNEGNTALHLSHLLNNKKIIEILNNNKIDFTIENNKGEMAKKIKENISSHKFIKKKVFFIIIESNVILLQKKK